MFIQISGFQGFSTNASIEAYVGMTFHGQTVTKVNKRSIIVSMNADPEQQKTLSDDLHVPFWALSAGDLPHVKMADGTTYQPKPEEVAMHTLCQLDAYAAVSAIAGVAEIYTRIDNAKTTPITDNFDQVNALTVMTVINKLVN